MFGLDAETTNNLIVGATVYLGMVAAAFWLAMIIWAYRDMRSRSRDALAQLLVGLLVAILNLPGLLIYLFLRPRETLSESYERSLEEEALLQEIEEKPQCPACRQRTQAEWQACPHCHTRLKKPCVRCGRMLELPWDLCPYCASAQPPSSVDVGGYTSGGSEIGLSSAPVSRRERRAARAAASASSSGTLEFIDGE